MSSSSSAVIESGRAAAQRSAFSQTCSLLSQYVKEKRAIGDLSLGMGRNMDGKGANDPFRRVTTTMNLFPGSEKPEEVSGLENGTKSMLPQLNMFPSSYSVKPSFSSDGKSAQMTIFYNGQVMVFDEFPAEKAQEIMELASKGSSLNTPSSVAAAAAANLVTSPVVGMKGMDTTATTTKVSNPIPTSAGGATASNTNNTNSNQEQQQQHVQLPTAPTLADLPIARKASLHRFLEKRKDRITAKAPYTTTNTKKAAVDAAAAAAPNKEGSSFSSSSWLGLAAAERNLVKSQQ